MDEPAPSRRKYTSCRKRSGKSVYCHKNRLQASPPNQSNPHSACPLAACRNDTSRCVARMCASRSSPLCQFQPVGVLRRRQTTLVKFHKREPRYQAEGLGKVGQHLLGTSDQHTEYMTLMTYYAEVAHGDRFQATSETAAPAVTRCRAKT